MKRTHLAVSTFVFLYALSAVAQSAGQKSFDTMKALAGNWKGRPAWGTPPRSRFA